MDDLVTRLRRNTVADCMAAAPEAADHIEALERSCDRHAQMHENLVLQRDGLLNRVEALENTLRQAREALVEFSNVLADYQCVDYHVCCGVASTHAPSCHAIAALASIDAVLSGAPPSEIADEQVLLLAERSGADCSFDSVVWFNDANLIAFARAVLAEGRKG